MSYSIMVLVLMFQIHYPCYIVTYFDREQYLNYSTVRKLRIQKQKQQNHSLACVSKTSLTTGDCYYMLAVSKSIV